MKITIECDSLEELARLGKALQTLVVLPAVTEDTPVEAMEFTVRTQNCLIAEDIKTLGALTRWTANALLRTPNLGRHSLKEIRDKLATHGLRLFGE